ncbi:unnamed protein product [Acanthosepion pharaonis]|uniref:Uncharacterized protein n=1 Tax=Acanthosepion pharaonis TaxID=158019 RepID=A0A812BD56_ACAPH|nr:unnamed protein product [Sepia pharaonis]
MRELLLNNNFLRNLPFELGKLFQLQTLGLQGNPLSPDILNLYNEPNGTQKLLSYMLDHLAQLRTKDQCQYQFDAQAVYLFFFLGVELFASLCLPVTLELN